jgi:hypothetical protein
MVKEDIIQTINQLPNEFTFDEFLDRVLVLEKIELGLEQSKSDDVFTTEQAKEKLKKWLR